MTKRFYEFIVSFFGSGKLTNDAVIGEKFCLCIMYICDVCLASMNRLSFGTVLITYKEWRRRLKTKTK